MNQFNHFDKEQIGLEHMALPLRLSRKAKPCSRLPGRTNSLLPCG